MARLYSTQFEVIQHGTIGALLQPDPGTIWVIRQVLVYSGNSATDGLIWVLEHQPSTAILLGLEFPDAHTGEEFFTGRIVIPHGQGVQAHTDAFLGSQNCDWYIGGYVLSDL